MVLCPQEEADMPEEVLDKDISGAEQGIEVVEPDATDAETFLKLRLPEVKTAVSKLEEAKIVTRATLDFKFSI